MQELGRSEYGTESLLCSQPVSLWQDWDQLWLGSEWEKKPCNFFLREYLGTRVGVVVPVKYRCLYNTKRY